MSPVLVPKEQTSGSLIPIQKAPKVMRLMLCEGHQCLSFFPPSIVNFNYMEFLNSPCGPASRMLLGIHFKLLISVLETLYRQNILETNKQHIENKHKLKLASPAASTHWAPFGVRFWHYKFQVTVRQRVSSMYLMALSVQHLTWSLQGPFENWCLCPWLLWCSRVCVWRGDPS